MPETVQIFIEGKDGLSPAAGKASRALGGVERAAISAKKRLNDMASGMSSLGNKLMLLSVPLIGIGVAATKMAMDAVESENLFEVSMGSMAGAARDFSERVREQLGLNGYEIRRQVGTWNTMLGSMGMAKTASFEMAKGLTMLANDMASFFNLRPEEAFEKLQAGITGEIEPLKRLGIIVSETTVKEWALTNGLIKQGQEMSEAQKVMARYGLIMEQTKNAQGDLARTIESPANQLRIFKGQLTETAVEAGQVFLPVLSGALNWINKQGMPAARKALDDFKESWTEMSDHAKTKMLIVAGLFLVGGPLLKGISMGIQGVGLLIAAFNILPSHVRLAVGAAGAAFFIFHEQIGNFFENWGKGLAIIGRGWGRVFPGAQAAKDLQEWGQSVSQWGRDMATAKIELGDVAQAALNLADSAIEPLTQRLESLGKGFFDTGKLTRDQKRLMSEEGVTAGMAAVKTHDAGTAAAFAAEQFKLLPPALGATKTKAKDAGDALKEAGISAQELMSSLIRFHPATVAAAGVTAVWESRITSLNLAIQANQDQLRAAQAEYGRMGDHLSSLNAQLSEAQRRFSELSRPRLTGMGDIERQMALIETQMKRVQFGAIQGLDVSAVAAMFPMLEAGAEQFLGTLPQTTDELQKMLEALRLTQGLKFDEQLRLLGQAAEGAQKELGFKDAMGQLLATKGRINELTGAIASQEAAMRSQQGVIAAIQAESERLNATLARYQEELKAAQANQQLVTQGLQMAFQWLQQDRDGFTKLGAEGERVAGVMDVKTRALLGAITTAASDTTGQSSTVLAMMVANYQSSMAAAMLEVGALTGSLNAIPRDILTLHTTIHRDVYESVGAPASVPNQGGRYGGSFRVPGFQTGGAFAVGGLGGPDSQLVAFRASPGEVVNITPPGQRSGGGIIDYDRLAAALAMQPIILKIDGEEIVVRGYERARQRGRI